MNAANTMAIQVIQDYIKRLKHQPKELWLSTEFEQQSYSKWVANDILGRLKRERSIPPLQLLEEYRERMDEYSCCNSKNSFMFSVAHDTAEDIIDELIKACHYY